MSEHGLETRATMSWFPVDQDGFDICVVRGEGGGWRLAGYAEWKEDDAVCCLHYEVDCDAAWGSRAARIWGTIGEESVELAVTATGDGRWQRDGRDQPALAGCLDVDLAFTPATNLIAIRRLALAVGDEGESAASWLRVPGLTLERLEQRYRRIAPDRYAYEVPATGYRNVLEVSDFGFVRRYPGLWESAGEWPR